MDRQKSVKKQKDMCRQNALAPWRNRKTRTRSERYRRARLHVQAASEVQSPHMMQRGDEKEKKKRRVRRKFGKTIRRIKRQKQRRHE